MTLWLQCYEWEHLFDRIPNRLFKGIIKAAKGKRKRQPISVNCGLIRSPAQTVAKVDSAVVVVERVGHLPIEAATEIVRETATGANAGMVLGRGSSLATAENGPGYISAYFPKSTCSSCKGAGNMAIVCRQSRSQLKQKLLERFSQRALTCRGV